MNVALSKEWLEKRAVQEESAEVSVDADPFASVPDAVLAQLTDNDVEQIEFFQAWQRYKAGIQKGRLWTGGDVYDAFEFAWNEAKRSLSVSGNPE